MAELVVLHTSDWHLGHQLYKNRRDEEFAAFLDWLIAVIDEYKVDVLVVAGDIFDTGAPAAAAQKMYYDFLGRASRSHCRHIVLVAGNHDSPAFLSAPGQLLRSLDITVVGAAREPEEEVFGLRGADGSIELVLCAVPYLRERDVRRAEPGESIADKEASLSRGIAEHYEKVARKALELRCESGGHAPVIATGHLYAVGALADESGEHDLYAGSLGAVPASVFSGIFDYVALGHLHRPQLVGGDESRRYSGSPLPMSFAEAEHEKNVVLVVFDGQKKTITPLGVPRFQKLVTLFGSRKRILAELSALVASQREDSREIWLEIVHDGSDAAGDLNTVCRQMAEAGKLKILRVNAHNPALTMAAPLCMRRLEDLTPEDIFQILLDQKPKLELAEKNALLATFQELLQLYHDSKREG